MVNLKQVAPLTQAIAELEQNDHCLFFFFFYLTLNLSAECEGSFTSSLTASKSLGAPGDMQHPLLLVTHTLAHSKLPYSKT